MKLRVRLSTGGETHKLSLPEVCTVKFLRERISATLAEHGTIVAPDEVRLSLNKTHEVGGETQDAQKALRAVGIAGGDLVFVMVGDPLPAAPASQPQAARSGARPVQASSTVQRAYNAAYNPPAAPVAAAPAATAPPPRAPPATPEERRAACLAAVQARLGGDPAESGVDPAGAVAVAPPPALRPPAEPMSVQLEEPPAVGDVDMEDSSGEAPEPGEDQKEMIALNSHPHLPRILVKVCQQEGGRLPVEGCPLRWRQELLALAVHAAVVEALAAAPAAYPLPPNWCARLGSSAEMRYEVRGAGEGAAAASAAVVARLHTLGPHLVVHAYLVPASELASPTIYSLCLSADEFTTAVQSAEDRRLEGVADVAARFTDVRAMWRAIKDGLVLKVQADAARAGALPPTPSLLALPEELRGAVLRRLPAPALAAVACASRELRTAASDDHLWQPLFQAEFGSRGAAPPLSWKQAFVTQWIARQNMRRQRRERPAHVPHPLMPSPFPHGFAPPSLFPTPGIIGGDYDLYPGLMPGMAGGGRAGYGPLGVMSGPHNMFPRQDLDPSQIGLGGGGLRLPPGGPRMGGVTGPDGMMMGDGDHVVDPLRVPGRGGVGVPGRGGLGVPLGRGQGPPRGPAARMAQRARHEGGMGPGSSGHTFM